MGFEGEIKEKYGRGTVKIDQAGTARLARSAPDKLVFALLNKRDPEEFAMIRINGDNWLMINRTPTNISKKEVPQYKPKYSESEPAKITDYIEDDNYVLQPKIDGAHVIISLDEHPRVFSHRQSKRSSRLLQHTYKIKDIDKIEVPKSLRGTIIRGELYGTTENGMAIPTQELGAILNATTENSLETQKIMKVKPRAALFDVEKYRGKDMNSEEYSKKLEVLKEIERFFKESGRGEFKVPETATNNETKKRLFERIESGAIPETKEGVVAWNLNEKSSRPIKIKIRPDYDVYVRKIFPQKTGKKIGETAGGFEYSLTPRGKIIGNVGTGFKANEKKDMWDNPKKYIGRAAKVKALSQFASGKLRAPAFTGEWHLEKGKQPMNKSAFISGFLSRIGSARPWAN